MKTSLAALLALAVIASACGGTPAATAPSTAAAAATAAATAAPTPKPPKDKIKLAMIPAPEATMASLVAYAKDYFGEENIEVEILLGSMTTFRAALIAKELDFGLFSFVHNPIARLAGSPMKAVTALYHREIFSLFANSSLKGTVTKVADLKGRTVGITQPGSAAWAIANVFLKKAGLNPEKDVSLVALGGDTSAIYTALASGKVDALISWEPMTQRILDTGSGYPLVPIWDGAAHKEYLGVDRALCCLLQTREDVIQAKRDLVRRLVNAHKKALAFMATATAAGLTNLVLENKKTAEQFAGLDKASVTKMIERIKPGYGDACLSRTEFDAEMKISVEYKLVKQAVTFEEFADTSFAGACPN